MKLEVIIPTYNRLQLLRNAIKSLLTAAIPPDLDVSITVVDNNSTDGTGQFVRDREKELNGRLRYVFEGRQGRSFALNAGIASGESDLVGMIDDDEEVDKSWYQRIFTAFKENGLDFIGGPYVPRWGARPPDWLPPAYLGVIGWVDGGNSIRAYGQSFPGILMGGNAVLTRSILRQVGPYNTCLSRRGNRLFAGEDEDMYGRLLRAGGRGYYFPDLIIYHYIPPERLTKHYFRRWCFWRGVSLGLLDRQTPSPVAHLGGVPRWLFGQAARGLARRARALVHESKPAESFAGELAAWDLAGFFYGKHFYRSSGAERSTA